MRGQYKIININGKYYYIYINKVYVAKVNELSYERRAPHYNISLFEDEDMLDFVTNLINVFGDYLYDTREEAEEKLKEREERNISDINESLDNIDRRLKCDKTYRMMFMKKFSYLFLFERE